ncbi:MAG TPA: flavodoxin-dependent (E)-4-hydroxy-3-methylbut-2-enyl-diphosphate synthase [Syntrophomonadaceae bacterium]|nr:flavodoxin-dependent (E)-4-hydroxy-3-methylbut-2-enyl-diphosphate synthase [Syntrophomonadaceae bacterium]HRX20326.1 flavodoxin-dependent (E)-4-hydroxy-3-methylbut-2-enyl-diphosphate synthase [Syntrophomonadaceae bacterium]
MKRISQEIKIGSQLVGGDNPIVVQSMTTTDTRDIAATIAQISELEAAGCEIIRVAVVDMEAAQAIARIKTGIHIPLVADIHFDHKLALKSVDAGADALRINPGNIGDKAKVKQVVKACMERDIPIRIGVNSGSLEKKLLDKYGHLCAEAMVESALGHVKLLEDLGFSKIKLSLKSSSVMLSVEAYRLIAQQVDYPLHIGITEAGTKDRALIKSALGMGILLFDGIGDTIRVSLTADPREEVWAAYEILRNLGLRNRGAELISCPTCGRCEINLIDLAEEVDRRVRKLDKPIKVAVMGCVVNGPGEAREADLGIAGGAGNGLLFKNGKIIKKVPEKDLVKVLLQEIDNYY